MLLRKWSNDYNTRYYNIEHFDSRKSTYALLLVQKTKDEIVSFLLLLMHIRKSLNHVIHFLHHK